jgi:hypothetical protein
LFDEE